MLKAQLASNLSESLRRNPEAKNGSPEAKRKALEIHEMITSGLVIWAMLPPAATAIPLPEYLYNMATYDQTKAGF